jgi:arylsulfatase A-like enzyme
LKTRRLAILLFGLGWALACCSRQPQLNVLVITIDTLRADHLGCYGYARPTSPRLDSFAADAVLFEKVFCQSPETLPSHTSIFTGMYPRTHKAISHESVVDKKITTLAEVLDGRGYATGAIISSHVLDAKYGLDQGFKTYEAIHYMFSDRKREEMNQREEDPTTDEALAWLRTNKEARFFLWIHWFHPHRPYSPPPRYREIFAGNYSGPAAEDQNDWTMKAWREQTALPPEDIAYMRGLYDGEVAFTDVQVGRVLDELASLGVAKNTLVVVTADHGEILYEHEFYFGHDIALYDECTMIPLIMRIPGVKAVHRRIGNLVQSIDILPTILGALGIAGPSEIEGKSLLPLIEGAAGAGDQYAFSETFPFPEKCPPRHAVRTAGAKLIWREERSGAISKQYYDLAADPGETKNLAAGPPTTVAAPAGIQGPGEAARLDGLLADWIRSGGLHPAPIPSAAESGRYKILKSLGYVD